MKEIDTEQLLWELGRLEEAEVATPPTDEELRNLRAGTIPAAQASALEARLARDAGARRRLVELAGIDDEAPPIAIRERVLEQSGRVSEESRTGHGGPGQVVPLRRPRDFRRTTVGRKVLWQLAAAALFLAVMVALLWAGRTPVQVPADLAYNVVATGLADVRSAPAEEELIEAYRDTVVRITASPRELGRSGFELGLYRHADGQLERLSASAELDIETTRDSATFKGRAEALVGTEAGIHRVYVVVGSSGTLPLVLPLVGSEDPVSALQGDGHRLVYPQRIRLLPLSP